MKWTSETTEGEAGKSNGRLRRSLKKGKATTDVGEVGGIRWKGRKRSVSGVLQKGFLPS